MQERAFTVVELITVVTVLGILAGIAIVSYGSWRLNVAQKEVSSGISQLQAQMEDALTFENQYPAEIPDGFKASPSDTTTTTRGTVEFTIKTDDTPPEGESYCARVRSTTVTGTDTDLYIRLPDNPTPVYPNPGGDCTGI